MRWVLRSKIHKATVTDANVAYVGSITIDGDLINRAGPRAIDAAGIVCRQLEVARSRRPAQ